MKTTLVLLFFAFDSFKCDWVEISQSPTGPTSKPPAKIETRTSLSWIEPALETLMMKPEVVKKNGTNTGGTTQASGTKKDKMEYLDKLGSIKVEDHTNGYTYTGFLPLMKTIQSTLLRNSHKHFNGKLNLLKSLKDSLLYNLREKMNEIWGERTPNNPDRSGRDYKDEHHVDFPSNEGALMTIGFLTFAVALIKLILQLLNSYGNINGNNNVATLVGRRKREAELTRENIELIKLIEEFNFKHKL